MHIPSNTINEFITEIYGAVVNTDRWPEILERTVQMAGAKGATICLVDYVAEELNSQFMSKLVAQMYPTYIESPHMDVELKALGRLPLVQSTTEFIDTQSFVKKANHMFGEDPLDISASEKWLYDEWSIKTRYMCRLNIQPSFLDLQTFLFGDGPKSQCQEGISKVDLLMPHFAKAIEISRPFLLLKARFQATLEVLDRFHLAVFIVSSNGSLALKNTAADRILNLADGVSIDPRGRIKSDQAINSPRVDKVIDEVLNKQKDGDINQSTELLLQRRSQSNPYLVEISPLSEPSVIGRLTGLMIIMIDPDNKKIVSTKGMEQMFGLSKAEDKVCQLLVDGHSTNEIAEIRNVSPVTVKNQINSVLSKTGNRNRSDLIRQALSINLPIDQKENSESKLTPNGV